MTSPASTTYGTPAGASAPEPSGQGLLASSPPIAESGRDAMAAGLRQVCGVRAVDFSTTDAPFVGLANRVQLPDVTLHFCLYDTPVDIGFGDMAGYRQFLCLSGEGEVSSAGRRIDLGPQSSVIAPPEQAFEARYGVGYAQLVVQFNVATLTRKKALFQDGDGPLIVPVLSALDEAAFNPLRQIALGLAAQFQVGRQRSSLVIAELEQALANAFLFDCMAVFPGSAPANTRPAHRRTAAPLSGWKTISTPIGTAP